jgi:hypothetical protein
MPRAFVCYHYPCPDGAFGALAAHLALPRAYTNICFVPLTVFSTPESRVAVAASTFTKADDVYLVDFSGGPAFLLAACERARRVVLIDHHKTAAEDLASLAAAAAPPSNLDTSFVDMARSGATLARDYWRLREDVLTEANGWTAARAEGLLRAFSYIEDNDLWRHALKDSKLFTAGFADLKLEFDPAKNPTIFNDLLAVDVDACIARGRAVIEEQDRIIAEELATSFLVRIPFKNKASASGGAAAALPAPQEGGEFDAEFAALAVITKHPDYRSVAGNRLAEKSAAASTEHSPLSPAGIVAYVEEGMGAAAAASTYKVSVRSLGDCDTTPVSRAYGGGGHKNASSFVVAKEVFEKWCVVGEERAGKKRDGGEIGQGEGAERAVRARA